MLGLLVTCVTATKVANARYTEARLDSTPSSKNPAAKRWSIPMWTSFFEEHTAHSKTPVRDTTASETVSVVEVTEAAPYTAAAVTTDDCALTCVPSEMPDRVTLPSKLGHPSLPRPKTTRSHTILKERKDVSGKFAISHDPVAQHSIYDRF